MAEECVRSERAMGIVGALIAAGEVHPFGVGRRSLADAQPPDEYSLFEIGSITKVFTALLLADMAAKGELALEDPLAACLPEDWSVPTRANEPIRLVHLATHTSGLPRMPADFDLSNSAAAWLAFGELELRECLAALHLKRKPGSGYEYSNLGAGLLGHVLALRAQCSYAELVTSRLLEPLDMRMSFVPSSPDREAQRFAAPFDAKLEPAERWVFGSLVGCGAIVSNVHDLVQFLEANMDPEHPMADLLASARAVHAEPKGEVSSIGLGWHIALDGSTRSHSGQTGGYHGYLAVNLELGIGVVVLSNTATVVIDRLGDRLFNLAMGVRLEDPALFVPFELGESQLAGLTGRYRSQVPFTVEVTARSGKLFARIDGPGQLEFRLLPRTATEFEYVDLEAKIAFELDEVGRAARLRFSQNGASYDCVRE